MVFDRKYYDKSKIEQAEISALVAAEHATMSAEERALRDQRMDMRFNQLLDRIEELRAAEPKSPSPEKIEQFKQHIIQADRLANALFLNLHAFTDNTIGTIHLIGDQFLISSIWEDGEKAALCSLISAAEDLWIDMVDLNDEKVIRIELKYGLA